ncbi:hypothetical protein [Chromobacterium violaceum]|uniref:Uncharacterized protein n=1 Tax=Chromobacterium violaceum TaxID=536 RepID=A0A202B5J7_CHRVL|nr:hypothetical protein [Chromobacterium violaceum]OVE46695.1 hypothetical protein CBW21_17515 [Chromobacterium violaceum]
MAKFQCPEGTTSVSVGGEQFNADDHGQIDAPDNAAGLLEPHGFKRVPEKAAADKPADPPAGSTPPQDEQTGTDGELTPPATPKTKKAAADKPAE